MPNPAGDDCWMNPQLLRNEFHMFLGSQVAAALPLPFILRDKRLKCQTVGLNLFVLSEISKAPISEAISGALCER